MSVFYTVYLVKTSQPEMVANKFSDVQPVDDSEWLICDYGDSDVDGIFEPDSDFTSEFSRQFGEVIFICVNERDDQFEYEHSKDGVLLRKLTWASDGCRSTWMTVQGEQEAWEDDLLFSEENFARALEIIKYGDHLELLGNEQFMERQQQLRAIWDARQYVMDGQWPLGDGTIGMAIPQYFGVKMPT
ncbi:MAG: hypothetical protein RKR03_07755 [Candidatus Competibacter sp.]|nr:hypothetical protein [Candidatus Competibacter sp.]MDS4069502.1 hypothetical protein [Candidatus Competibacter sp.]